MGNKGSYNLYQADDNGPTTGKATRGQINTDTRPNNDRQNGLNYVANLPDNLAKKSIWTRGDRKDILTAFKKFFADMERINIEVD